MAKPRNRGTRTYLCHGRLNRGTNAHEILKASAGDGDRRAGGDDPSSPNGSPSAHSRAGGRQQPAGPLLGARKREI